MQERSYVVRVFQRSPHTPLLTSSFVVLGTTYYLVLTLSHTFALSATYNTLVRRDVSLQSDCYQTTRHSSSRETRTFLSFRMTRLQLPPAQNRYLPLKCIDTKHFALVTAHYAATRAATNPPHSLTPPPPPPPQSQQTTNKASGSHKAFSGSNQPSNPGVWELCSPQTHPSQHVRLRLRL